RLSVRTSVDAEYFWHDFFLPRGEHGCYGALRRRRWWRLHQGIAQLTQARHRLLQSLRIANDNRRLRQPVPTLGLRGGEEVTDNGTRSLNRASVIIDGERRFVCHRGPRQSRVTRVHEIRLGRRRVSCNRVAYLGVT